MPRSTIALVLIVLASMLGVWYFGSRDQRAPAGELAQAATTPAEVVPSAAPELHPTPSREAVRKVALQNEIENLQAELNKKSQALDSQKRSLEQLQQQQRSYGGVPEMSSQIQSRDLAIQSLVEDMGHYRQAEDDINNSASAALQNQDSQARLARDEVDTNIANLQRDIRDTENDLNYWRNNPAGQDVINQPANVERLQNQLAEQRNRLTELRSQRVDISASVLSNSQTIRSMADQAKAELRDSAHGTQDQIFSLRSEIDRLQGAQSQYHSQLQGINQQISRTEKDIEDQSAEVRRLQESLQSKQSELQAQ